MPSSSESTPHTRKTKRKRQVIEDAPGEVEKEDLPVLSHAERRKQKKRAKLASKDAQEEEDSKQEVPPKKHDAALPRQNSVWVGNLSFKTTPDALRTFFEGVGEVTRVNMPCKPGTKEIRGSALKTLPSPDFELADVGMY